MADRENRRKTIKQSHPVASPPPASLVPYPCRGYGTRTGRTAGQKKTTITPEMLSACQHVSNENQPLTAAIAMPAPPLSGVKREKNKYTRQPLTRTHTQSLYQKTRHPSVLRNAWVAGSSPAGGSNVFSYLIFCLLCIAVGRGITEITNAFFAFFARKRLARSRKKAKFCRKISE